ncbi:exonuclease V a 5' deoxyribonuclease-domain-containing protein [Aspergillus pseudonomiae]|uniref:Exonuclease V a 5' deoxyribonuclease-domain-containing protein n=1 Tax=Aspergillus pseudonomiae TaxID=1506151 RepID=A0A5N7D6J2_9EURO|nr:exonuclease V a 5' deoxyribonuclease-domain-containing protein [Aspergillus pseudonomiae]KAE8401909.1 exonuclease V a 5' deoxyribonuclease-domain-containing protein [Aspergillus pseudonomiae]
MSCPQSSQRLMKDTISDNSSDYGSDFTPDEEEILNELLTQAVTEHAALHATPPPQPLITTPTAKETNRAVGDIEDCHVAPSSPRTPKVLGRQKPVWQVSRAWQSPAAERAGQMASNGGAAFVEHPDSTEGRTKQRERDIAREREWTTGATDPAADDRSPIERFRKPPNKAFSVTDLISPAWCELQYWYTLTKFGRKRRTAAMKKGTTIHKTLEDEIYMTVPVEITTKEDALALRIWNIIQGLRTLREYGMTRELEVWGLVDGELVNGVIDQLSYECPDPELEATAASYYADVEASRAVLPEYQMSLSDYLLSPSQGGKRLSDLSWNGEEEESLDDSGIGSESSSEAFNLPRIYMTDVKTRASAPVPTVKSSSFRPTLLQLQMYYHMLNRLATSDDVSIELLASRYDLDPTRPFTATFIAEVGGLNDQFFDTCSSPESESDFTLTPEDAAGQRASQGADSTPPGSQDSTSILLAHNDLTSLWKLMKDQLRLTFLPPAHSTPVSVAPSIPSEFQPGLLEPYPTVLSPLLTARYLSSAPTTEAQSRVLGSRSFLFDPTTMTAYLSDQMEWWRGERNPRGVEVMDAWKCRICEFRDECSWRQERELAFTKRRRRSSSLAV